MRRSPALLLFHLYMSPAPKEMEGTKDEQRWARTIIPVISRHHHLLVALLLVNAGANEALPIFLDRIVSPQTAILVSVTCVLLFGALIIIDFA